MQHRVGTFNGVDDYAIFWQAWFPEGEPRAALMVAHGYAEHSGRYGNLVRHFVPEGYAVYALDHRGHGRSGGPRVYIEDFEDYTTDLRTFQDIIEAEQPGKPVVLIGHSMGSYIALGYAARHQETLAALVLSGGGMPDPKAPPPPPLPPAGARLDLSQTLSRDPKVAEDYTNDPLVYLGPRPDRSPLGSMRARLPEMVPTITLPVLIMAGGASPLGEGEGSRVLHEYVGSKDRALQVYPELMHEIFNEPEHPQVFADLEGWLAERL